jgi:hypothetical protein
LSASEHPAETIMMRMSLLSLAKNRCAPAFNQYALPV